MSEKACNTCEISKSLDNFTVNNRNKDGKDNRCKACQSEKNIIGNGNKKKEIII